METIGRPQLTRNEWKLIDKQLREKGIVPAGYAKTEKIVETDIECPICGQHLIFSRLANSTEIRCKEDNCLCRTIRGI